MSEENKIDFEELKKEATLLTDPEIPASVMNAPMSDGNTSIDTDGLIISDDDFDDDEVSDDTEATMVQVWSSTHRTHKLILPIKLVLWLTKSVWKV